MGLEVLKVRTNKRIGALVEVQDRFNVARTVQHLQSIMERVTENEISADTVNAACNCVASLNLTIKTAINAAKFISDTTDEEEE